MRSDVKTALKTHLDNLNIDKDKFNDKDRVSEANLSMATSEISNCDSKDVAELESMLSTSPHHNGLTHDETDLDHDVTRAANDVTRNHSSNDVTSNKDKNDIINNDVTHCYGNKNTNDLTATTSNQSSLVVIDDDKELSSVEKSKRVLFSDDGDVDTEQGKE